MMLFVVLAALAALAAALLIARPLVLTRRAAPPRAAHDEQVLRDQLAEIDRDHARGTLGEADAEAARVEVSRRLLAAAAEREAAPDHAPAPAGASRALALIAAVLLPLGAGLLYGQLGFPGLPDRPLSGDGLSQSAFERLIGVAGERPIPPDHQKDIDALRARAEGGERTARYFLAEALLAAGRPRAAWPEYKALIDSTDGEAPAPVFSAMGEAMVLAAGGYLSPDARAAFDAALSREPADPVARYYKGAALAQAGDRKGAAAMWTRLLAESGPEAPWREAVIARLRAIGAPIPDSAAPGPTAEQMRDAQQMSPEDRAEMIRGMVARLRERLESEGGPPEDWAKLIRALAVSGDIPGAQDAFEAGVKAHPEATELLDAEAARAGLTK